MFIICDFGRDIEIRKIKNILSSLKVENLYILDVRIIIMYQS